MKDNRLDQWLEKARALKWISSDEYAELKNFSSAGFKLLAHFSGARPIIVTLFGGTGVGKSSLINAIAGWQVAETGVKRPTSTGITVYHHRGIKIAELPPEIPAAKTILHEEQKLEKIILVDMPDIDSRVTDNYAKAISWLKFADVVAYVVSPERYKDSRGYIEIKRHGGKHAWIFVFNQRDVGDASQLDDFTEILQNANFARPLIFTTALLGGDTYDLDKLKHHLTAMARQKLDFSLIPQFLNINNRGEKLTGIEQNFATGENWRRIIAKFNSWLLAYIDDIPAKMITSGETSIDFIAAKFKLKWKYLLMKTERDIPDGVCDGLADIVLRELEHAGISSRAKEYLWWLAARSRPHPLWRLIGPRLDLFTQNYESKLKSALTHAVRKPGGWMRFFHLAAGVLRFLLPAASASFIGMSAYHKMMSGVTGSLNFAVYAGVILVISWLAPALLYRLSSPSISTSLKKAITKTWDYEKRKLVASLRKDEKTLLAERIKLLRELERARSRILSALKKTGEKIKRAQLEDYTALNL